MRLLSVAVSIFGPHKVVEELFGHASNDEDRDLDRELFMQVFKDEFVPWCLNGSNQSADAHLDLLLALLDDNFFSEQWPAILTYATNPSNYKQYPKSDGIKMLAMFLEKARAEISKRKVIVDPSCWNGTNLGLWHHEILESTAVYAASCPPSGTWNSQFLWYVNLESCNSHVNLSNYSSFLYLQELANSYYLFATKLYAIYWREVNV